MGNGYIVHRSENSMAHFGIKGMKWGVRRYQNKDGSLTQAGKVRYGSKTGNANGDSKILYISFKNMDKINASSKYKSDEESNGALSKKIHDGSNMGEWNLNRKFLIEIENKIGDRATKEGFKDKDVAKAYKTLEQLYSDNEKMKIYDKYFHTINVAKEPLSSPYNSGKKNIKEARKYMKTKEFKNLEYEALVYDARISNAYKDVVDTALMKLGYRPNDEARNMIFPYIFNPAGLDIQTTLKMYY